MTLGCTRGTSTELAWLCESHTAKSLWPRSWAAQPEVGGLSVFAPDFALNAHVPWLVGERCERPQLPPETLPPLKHRVEPSAADFARMHEQILAHIAEKRFQKVVPVVCESLEFAAPLNAAMFPRALQAPEGQYAYGFAYAGEGMCGVTPELLFAVHDGVLQTMALAGTGPAQGPSLMDNPKERLEHQLVIEHIQAELTSFGDVTTGATTERLYGRLKHLHTPIQVRLQRPPDFLRFVVALHPTAALGGWPRRPAMEWLQAQDVHEQRARFGAPFGYVDGDTMKCVVAIRGVQWWGTRALIATGCGVVDGSQALSEWRELELKRRAIYDHLGLEL